MTRTQAVGFEVAGWKSTRGVTLGFRFGAENARRFVDPAWSEVIIELDGQSHALPIRDSFWRRCPEIRGEESNHPLLTIQAISVAWRTCSRRRCSPESLSG